MNMHHRKSEPDSRFLFATLILICLPVTLLFCSVAAAAAPAPDSSREIEREIKRLEAVSDALANLHHQLTINANQMSELHQRALQNLQGNLLKVYVKGGMDIWNKASAPIGAVADLVAEALLNLYVEPIIYIPQKDQVALLSLSKTAAEKNHKLKSLYQAIGEVMAADASRFDDDRPPLRYASPWWKTPDGKNDDQTELVTRKTHIIIELSDKVYQATVKDQERVRQERRIILQQIERLQATLHQTRTEEKILADTDAWHERLHQREQKRDVVTVPDDRGESLNAQDRHRRGDTVMTAEQRAAQQKAQREREEIYRKKAEAIKVMKAKEDRATVYMPSDIPRHYVVGDRVVFSALIEPPEVKGAFEWRLDDKRIGTGPNATFTFTTPGVFDLSVTLNIRFKFQDRYVDQIRVEAAPDDDQQGPSLYPPDLEGKKIQAMNLACCKYWVLHEDNKVYLTGHYHTPAGKRIEYTSEAIKNYVPAAPTAGMFALKSGHGYHIYQTYGARPPWVKYIVAQMTPSGVTVIHRLEVTRLEIKIAPDLSTATIIYRNENDGSDRKITLH